MSKPGDDLEKIVELIERSISPTARIEQNVFLPVLTSTQGHTAQCDIIIRNGPPHRKTLTIVEVQDRNSKVDINTFRGWLGKIEDVGAQHLICVSRKDFASSIKEKAAQSGSKIFLITLKDLSPEKIPLDFIKFIFLYQHIDIKRVRSIRPYVGSGQIEKLGLKSFQFELTDKLWSLDKINMISLLEICRASIKGGQSLLDMAAVNDGVGNVSFSIAGEDTIYFFHNDGFVRIGLDCEFEWEFEHAEIPMSVACYEQDEHGALAWLFEVIHNSKSGPVSVKIPVVKLDDGNYKLLGSIINAQFEHTFDIVPKPNN
ncbi:restriction endonuclease [Pseudomonas fluorescens]|uniref:restriction endonuclease n=1 Tax=Pseudomonas fluorescens TaxID=294 RepID=UPI00177BDD08|nr:restriction endonuclease [Pseudomonas fluorescens]